MARSRKPKAVEPQQATSDLLQPNEPEAANNRVAELTAEIEAKDEKIKDLERRIEELEGEIEDHECVDDSEEIRDQLESLAIDAGSASAPQTPEQWRRCLDAVRSGTDWQYGTWKC